MTVDRPPPKKNKTKLHRRMRSITNSWEHQQPHPALSPFKAHSSSHINKPNLSPPRDGQPRPTSRCMFTAPPHPEPPQPQTILQNNSPTAESKGWNPTTCLLHDKGIHRPISLHASGNVFESSTAHVTSAAGMAGINRSLQHCAFHMVRGCLVSPRPHKPQLFPPVR